MICTRGLLLAVLVLPGCACVGDDYYQNDPCNSPQAGGASCVQKNSRPTIDVRGKPVRRIYGTIGESGCRIYGAGRSAFR